MGYQNKNLSVIIKGAYGDANVGDDLLLEMVMSLLDKVKERNFDIKIVCRSAPYLQKKYREVKFISLAASKFESPDIYILGGGTQFFSFENPEKVSPAKSRFSIYMKSIFKEPTLLAKYILSIFSKNKKESLQLALGVGLGPFETSSIEEKVKKQMKSFFKIYPRDHASKEFLEKWGLSNWSLSADLCLTDIFKDKYPIDHVKRDEIKLGIVLRDWSHNDIGKVINDKVLDWTLSLGSIKHSLFIFSKLKDNSLIERVRRDYNKLKTTIWDPEIDDFYDFLKELNSCDILITSRYHTAIFALNLGIPTICLGIDPKLKILCDEVDGFYHWQHHESMAVIDKFVESIKHDYSNHVLKVNNSYRVLNGRANSMVKDVIELLDQHKNK
ncbi:polysaccharide pyruvyl transferase family protein [Sphingobacterium sp. UBA5996]|uniref:polysaccharide pyruvyl transferase family protein n=1 Tax=Sphingobacterium sp. UBA5996 TaxID=1947505 RepID=UPI0025F40752|nr:polysaccharide pyruvyl transferase family protein [Sphingobacterium sp. UBA5996]